jgi:hypothetical protein
MIKKNIDLVIRAVRTAGAHNLFDMLSCTHCILGTSTRNIEALRMATPESARSSYDLEAFAKFCGITEMQSHNICYPKGDAMCYITPKGAIAMLKRLKETGKVKFNKKEN